MSPSVQPPRTHRWTPPTAPAPPPGGARRAAPVILPAFLVLLLGASSPAPTSEGSELGTLASYRRALAAVERAAAALGGSGGLDAVAFTLEMEARAQYQSPRPEPPYLEVPVILEVVAAPGHRWARVTTTTAFPEATFRNRRILGPGGGATIDLGSGGVTPARLDWEDFHRDFRRSPQLVIRDAWERRSHLRWLGTATIDGTACDLVTFPYFGATELTVAIDREGRVLRHEHLFDDVRQGDASVVAQFLDYRREDGRWVPGRMRQVEAGLMAIEGRYTRMTVGGEPEPATFKAPAPDRDEGRAEPAPPGAREEDREEERVVRLAEGVHLVRRLEGGDYNSLLVDLGSSFAVVEAPLGPAAAAEIVAAARELDPEKPIRHVIPTHHHADHAGGVPHLARLTGAAVVTTPGNEAFFRQATAARRTLGREPVVPEGPAELVLLESGEWEIRGQRTLRILDVGPTGHAEEMLVAWLPESGILFQGDLIRFPEEGALEPARPWGRRLAEYLEAAGLEPSTVAGVHGRVGTLDELRQAVAAAGPGPAAAAATLRRRLRIRRQNHGLPDRPSPPGTRAGVLLAGGPHSPDRGRRPHRAAPA